MQAISNSPPKRIADWFNRVREWLIVSGNRAAVAVGLMALFLVFFGMIELLGLVPLSDVQPTFYIFSGLIGGNLTLITVVVSINQLLLSRELQTPGEIQSDIDDVIDFRREVEAAAETVPPASTLEFFHILVENAQKEVQNLRSLRSEEIAEPVRNEVNDILKILTDRFNSIDDLIHQSNTTTFPVLSLSLTRDCAQQLPHLRQVQAKHREELPDAAHESIDNLCEWLRDIDVARQYFRSLYLEDELASLSQNLIIVGLPAEAIAIATLLFLTGIGSESIAMTDLHILIPITLTISLLPLAILSSFILRAATMAKRSDAILPFIRRH